LDAGRPTTQNHKSNDLGISVAPITVSASMDRLDDLKRATASAALKKSSSGDIVSGSRSLQVLAGKDRSVHLSLKRPNKGHKLDMKVTYS
jgi:hypothetical protein